jgi:hypothetical protein
VLQTNHRVLHTWRAGWQHGGCQPLREPAAGMVWHDQHQSTRTINVQKLPVSAAVTACAATTRLLAKSANKKSGITHRPPSSACTHALSRSCALSINSMSRTPESRPPLPGLPPPPEPTQASSKMPHGEQCQYRDLAQTWDCPTRGAATGSSALLLKPIYMVRCKLMCFAYSTELA